MLCTAIEMGQQWSSDVIVVKLHIREHNFVNIQKVDERNVEAYKQTV